jgi:hypothetical protein
MEYTKGIREESERQRIKGDSYKVKQNKAFSVVIEA